MTGNEHGPSSAEIKLNGIKPTPDKRKELAAKMCRDLIDRYDIDPCDLYDPDYIITLAKELQG